ncbi:MAG: ribonuclease E/G [Phenylobacterium sp.]|uniref:ribonuclease E/G n=1 Tax=Phenylobacterium sp. TaxID=1871053 RepID=UPI003918FB83
MSRRALFLDRAPGESRGVVTLDGRPERLLILREGESPLTRAGARLAARVRKVEPAFVSAFVDLGGVEAFLPYRPEERPVQGQLLEVEIRIEPRAEKLATVRAIGPAHGEPGLIAPAPDLAEQLAGFSRGAEILEGPEARRVADQAEAEALETVHPLPGGGSLAIEPTRALVAVDVDLGARTGQDAKRITRQTNLAALGEAARLLRLKGLGGLVVVDLAGRGHDGNALLTAARAAFAPDNPGVAIGPVSRFGTMELTVPRRVRSVREILDGPDGAPSDRTLALRLVRAMETEALAQGGAQVEGRCAPSVADAAGPLVERLVARFGARFALHPEPRPRESLEAVAR